MRRAMWENAIYDINLAKEFEENIEGQASIDRITKARNSALEGFWKIVLTNTVGEFGGEWKEYYREYSIFTEWMNYLISFWLKYSDTW